MSAAGLVTELVELAYIPLARSDAELLFRVLGERNELRPIVITTNLPFSEWTTKLVTVAGEQGRRARLWRVHSVQSDFNQRA